MLCSNVIATHCKCKSDGVISLILVRVKKKKIVQLVFITSANFIYNWKGKLFDINLFGFFFQDLKPGNLAINENCELKVTKDLCHANIM